MCAYMDTINLLTPIPKGTIYKVLIRFNETLEKDNI